MGLKSTPRSKSRLRCLWRLQGQAGLAHLVAVISVAVELCDADGACLPRAIKFLKLELYNILAIDQKATALS